MNKYINENHKYLPYACNIVLKIDSLKSTQSGYLAIFHLIICIYCDKGNCQTLIIKNTSSFIYLFIKVLRAKFFRKATLFAVQ